MAIRSQGMLPMSTTSPQLVAAPSPRSPRSRQHLSNPQVLPDWDRRARFLGDVSTAEEDVLTSRPDQAHGSIPMTQQMSPPSTQAATAPHFHLAPPATCTCSSALPRHLGAAVLAAFVIRPYSFRLPSIHSPMFRTDDAREPAPHLADKLRRWNCPGGEDMGSNQIVFQLETLMA